IGTIGHKSITSDLDLQVIYDLTDHERSKAEWTDNDFFVALTQEHAWWIERMQEKEGLSATEGRKPEVLQGLAAEATMHLKIIYPLLSEALLSGSRATAGEIADPARAGANPQLAEELITLAIRNGDLIQSAGQRRREALLREKVALVQKYIAEKYPSAEIYMFACALEMYRAGRYTSSLEFKESSGSAYELLLNWETLMPGIQFTPSVPSHFLLPTWANQDSDFFRRLRAGMEFGGQPLYREIFPTMVDLGNTPALGSDYVVEHRGAVYWEAFKASSGNLPKATLNLLRYEMLLEPPLQKTIIEIIKEPKFFDALIAPRSGDTRADRAALENENTGVPTWALLELEKGHPLLLRDPWWLRYKALKVGFGEARGIPSLTDSERAQISKILDLAIALHVRISDVFTKPGDTRPLDSHRERVLVDLLETAFPLGSAKRQNLEHLFMGEMKAVSRFESDLRFHFRWALERVQRRIGDFDLDAMRRENEEVRLWHHYFEQNFEPDPKAVQRTIMHHLKISRGRLVIGHAVGEGWAFRSLQKASTIGKRFDTFGILNHLPEQVTLVEGHSFLFCLATCIVNGYYGILNPGTLKESRTALQYDLAQMEVGSELDKEAASVRLDHLDRILDLILAFFPPEHHHYLDHIRVKRRVGKVMVFLNLWKFGRLSVLYRDNLGSWYCDDFDHPELVERAEALQKEPAQMLGADPLHTTFSHFLWDRGVKLSEVELEAWVNPNSVETTHEDPQSLQKQRDLSRDFLLALHDSHPGKAI
ncbi:MAG: hypothetical protein V3S29_08245, partial [bacterium]